MRALAPWSGPALALVLALLVGAAPVAAQSPAEPPAVEADEPEAAAAEAEALPPAGADDGPPSDADFIPSERIPADASLAFPVDI